MSLNMTAIRILFPLNFVCLLHFEIKCSTRNTLYLLCMANTMFYENYKNQTENITEINTKLFDNCNKYATKYNTVQTTNKSNMHYID